MFLVGNEEMHIWSSSVVDVLVWRQSS